MGIHRYSKPKSSERAVRQPNHVGITRKYIPYLSWAPGLKFKGLGPSAKFDLASQFRAEKKPTSSQLLPFVMKHFQDIFFVTGALLVSLIGAISRPDTPVVTTRTIPNSYIVVLKDDASPTAFSQHLSWLRKTNEQVGASQFAGQKHLYNIGNFKGYAGEFNDLTVARIKARPEVYFVTEVLKLLVTALTPQVAYIEPDGVVTVSRCASQDIAPYDGEWGLGRISHKTVGPWDQYVYDDNQSRCATPLFAYVIDSGVQSTHKEFEGRATQIWKFNPDWKDDDDCGHGTHVSGTIGGKTYGVMKRSTIYACKALIPGPRNTCSGSWAGVIAAIDFAYRHAAGNRSKSVINMSLGQFQISRYFACLQC